MSDRTHIEVVLQLSPDELEAIAILVDAEVESVGDLIADAKKDGQSPAFVAELRTLRDHWRRLQLPLLEASKRLRDRITAAGEIDTEPCPLLHDHNRLQQRADEDGFPRVCEGCERRFERVDF